jgi:hypothetical protein
VKIFCKVNGKQAVVVGYGPGRKGKVRAIVICEGRLQDVALRQLELDTPNTAGKPSGPVTYTVESGADVWPMKAKRHG